ncbi:hypothetical protein ACFQS1_19835 [Paractinoplanes rhizophilus]|uniref:Uncharacterized protein n=1 Tax=Paractinoplanes rhizophilus TaxID=1416877 RepID=A0ABW2HT29_9ACTN
MTRVHTQTYFTAFDRHRRAGACLSPLAIGLRADRRGIWRFPPQDPTQRVIWPAPVIDLNSRRAVPSLPGSYQSGDVAYELDDVWLVDPDDPSVGAEARFIQAKAMAAGLNAAVRDAGENGKEQ